MGTPKRTRAHRLEDASKTAFRALCDEAGWIVRDMPGDYGIDLEVEIFDNDSTTGMTFRVQLKGTDRLPGKSRKVSIQTATLNYWRSFDVPVLVVYFTSCDGALYGTWAHAHDLGKDWSEERKTTTFKFPDESRLANALDRIGSDTMLIRAYKQHIVGLPLVVDIGVGEQISDDGKPMSTTAARVALRSLAQQTSGVLRLSGPGDEILLTIKIDRDTFKASLSPDITSLTFHGYIMNQERLLDDCFLACSILLGNVGWDNEAARLLSLIQPATLMSGTLETTLRVAEIFARADKHPELLKFALKLSKSDSPDRRDAGGFLLVYLQDHLKELTRQEQRRLAKGWMSLGKKEDEKSEGTSAAYRYYNAGQVLNAIGRLAEAAAAYNKAVAIYPEYARRPYFQVEFAGLLFNMGRHSEAADHYEQALEMGALRQDVEPLLVEAKLWAGQYASALVLAEKWDEDESEINSFAVVNRITLQAIIGVTSLDSQDRRPISGDSLGDLKRNPGWGEVVSEMRRCDALDLSLWGILLELDDERDVEERLVAMAHLGDSAHWWVAAISAVLSQDLAIETTEAVISQALFAHGTDLLDAVDWVMERSEGQEYAYVLQAVHRVAASQPEKAERMTIRIHDASEAEETGSSSQDATGDDVT